MARGFRIAGHPVHPMIIPFPIVLYTLALLGDIVYLSTGNPFWYQLGYTAMGFGLLTALMAAGTGLFEYLTVPRRIRAKRVANYHLAVNLSAFALMLVSFISRSPAGMALPEAPLAGAALGGAVFLTVAAFGLTLAGGWYGGDLVYVFGVGVSETGAENRRMTQARVPTRMPQHEEPAPPRHDEAH